MRYLDLIHSEGCWKGSCGGRRSFPVDSRHACRGRVRRGRGPDVARDRRQRGRRPFTTHHNALDITLYLRIALELHLKRLLVGGIERVYELGRVYRNGDQPAAQPEFTMLEVYQAYGDYRTMMDLTEKIIADAILATGGRARLAWGDAEIDFSPAVCAKNL